ncbi:MAG: hypothetical protein ACIAQU_02200 [Phycisphaerales bacterium JB064]
MNVTRHRSWPRLLLAAGVGLVIAPALVWVATGREGYTRWPDAKLAASDTGQSEEHLDLLEDIGLTTEEEVMAQPDIESRFALGLLPGGFTPKYLVSAAPLAVFGVGLFGAGLFATRRSSRLDDAMEVQP